MDQNTLGSRIKQLRINRGLTQEQIASRLEMKRSNIANYESGRVMPPTDTLGRIADILNTSTDYLLDRNQPDLIGERITLESRFLALEKELAELKMQVLGQQTMSVEEVKRWLDSRFSGVFRNPN